MTTRAWTLLLLLASLWGASYMFIKVGLEDLSPAWVVLTRVALGGLVLLPFALARNALTPLRRALPAIVVLAAVQVAGPFLLISFGEERISSSLAGILVASTPVITALLAPVFDSSESSSGRALVGVGIGIAGVGLLLGLDAGGSGAELVGGLMILLASLGYVLGAFLLKSRLAGAPPVGVVTLTMGASALMVLPWALLTTPSEFPSLDAAASVATLGVAGTGIAFVIFYGLIGTVGAARAALVAYIAPIFAVFYGVVLLSESVSVATFLGLALIVGGSWLAAGGRRTEEPAQPCVEGIPDTEPPAEGVAPDAGPLRGSLASSDGERRPAAAQAEPG